MPPASPAKSSFRAIAAAFLVLVLAAQLIYVSRATSMTWDEGHHLYDGYNIWKNFDYRLNPEVPPLLKLVSAVPLLHGRLAVPPNQEREEQTEAYLDGRAFLLANGYDRILVPARMASMIFTLALAVLLYFAASEIFGPLAALIALLFFVFDPNFLAHGALVTTDVPSAALMLASVYAWYRYSKRQTALRLALVGLAVGLGLVVKFTGLFFWPMLLVLAVAEALQRRSLRIFRQRVAALAVVGIVAYGILWSFYGFRYAPSPEGRDTNPPFAAYLHKVPRASDAAHLELAAKYHLLPEAYIFGLANTKITENADTCYFFGRVRRHGTWLYFPAAFLIKSTLPLLLLLCLVPFAWRSVWWRSHGAGLGFLLLPVAIYLAIAMSSSMNIGHRHLLPVYPFLYILAAGSAAALYRRSRHWAGPIGFLLVWQVATSAYAAPGYMGYGNEAWGGPDSVHKYLSDANTDWGQQLKDVKRYIDEHHITNCWFAYFADGVVEPSDYGIHCKRLPTQETTLWMNLPMDVPAAIDGTVFLSDSDLQGIEYGEGALNPYDSFHAVRPTTVIEHGLWVYDGHFELPVASAMDRAEKADTARYARNLEAALAYAQQAVRLAPHSVRTQTALADVLSAQGRTAEARTHYEAALRTARTIEPELQADSVPGLEEKLAGLPVPAPR